MVMDLPGILGFLASTPSYVEGVDYGYILTMQKSYSTEFKEYDLTVGMTCPSCKAHIAFDSDGSKVGGTYALPVHCPCGFSMMVVFGTQTLKKLKFGWEKL